jgi:long-chain fatty acid transport protein
MKVGYGQLATAAPSQSAQLGGNGIGYGFTLGATITPTATTKIGIGYRSQIDQKIEGSLSVPAPAVGTAGSINTKLRLPSTLTVGLRQEIGPQFALLAGFEWANWSRIGTASVLSASGGAATINGNPINLPFNYSDGYFYSLGGEYAVSPLWTLRAGIAFEKSPITDQVRTPRLPDNDRMWYSVGSSWKPREFKGLTFDLGYSLVVAKDTPINISAASGNPWFSAGLGSYIGSVNSKVHIISVAARYQWDDEANTARRTR